MMKPARRIDSDLAKLINDAKAQIMFGASITDVGHWLSTRDLQEEDVVLVIKHCFNHCMRERGSCVCKEGIKDVLIGVLLLAIGTVCIVLWQREYWIDLLFAGLGSWRLTKGVGRIIEGARIKASVVPVEHAPDPRVNG